MKELSIEQKAKRYDEALEKAMVWKDKSGMPKDKQGILDNIFPELKENEDEKMRKELIHYFSDGVEFLSLCSFSREEIIAWLEKQSTPQVRTGLEWVNTIDDACDKLYAEEYAHGEYCHEQSFKWGFQEGVDWLEKQGKDTSWKPSKEEMDVLYGLAYITNQYDEHKEEVITRLYQDLKREFFNGSSYENMFPNTEDGVRRRSTIQVLEYARSLDTYNQYGKADIDKNIAWLEKQGEQKPAWSEKDKQHIDSLLKRLDGLCRNEFESTRFAISEDVDWLKSLKDRVQPKQEWGEEDKKKLNRIYTLLAEAADKHAFSTTCRLIGDKECVELQDFLRSLRPQPKQEWSEKDTEILNGIANFLFTSTDVSNVEGSDEWYDWLKSLKNRVQKSF